MILIGYAQVLVVMLTAGFVLNALSVGPILGLQAGLAALLFLATVPRLGWPRLPSREWYRANVTVFRQRPSWFVAAAGLLTAVAVVVRGVTTATLPPYAGDALWYHITSAAYWLQSHRIVPTHLVFLSDVYPINGELLTAWPMALLHSVAFSSGAQFVALLLGAVASATIAKQLGVPAKFAWLAGAVFAISPIVVAQASVAYVDLLVSAFFVSGLSFGLAVHRRDGPMGAPCLLAGMAAGLLIGTKLTGLIYASLIAVVVAVGLLRRRRPARRGRSLPALGFLALLLIFGAPSIARTWVTTGDPVYPVQVKVAGSVVFAGNPRLATAVEYHNRPSAIAHESSLSLLIKSWAHDADPLLNHPRNYVYDQLFGGFGPQWIYLELPALLLVAAISLRRRRCAPLLVMALLLVAFLATPNLWWARFEMWVPAIGAAALAWVIWRLDQLDMKFIRTIVQLALVACMAYSVAFTARTEIGVAGGGRISVQELAKFAIGRGDSSTPALMPSFSWLAELKSPTVIALQSEVWIPSDIKTVAQVSFAISQTFDYFPSPLFGDHLQNRVVPIRPVSRRAVVANVHAARATVLVTIRGSQLDKWAASDPVDFHHWITTTGRPAFSVYRVVSRLEH
jgi:hypothetical protein